MRRVNAPLGVLNLLTPGTKSKPSIIGFGKLAAMVLKFIVKKQ